MSKTKAVTVRMLNSANTFARVGAAWEIGVAIGSAVEAAIHAGLCR
jgi:hypothetical protein